MKNTMMAKNWAHRAGSAFARVALVSTVFGLAACAGADYRPVVDMQGHTTEQYNADLATCQGTARQARNNQDIAVDTGVGALGGAALGAVGGAIGGNAGLGAGVGALAGALVGGGYKEADTEKREERIVKNCMVNKGYKVLD